MDSRLNLREQDAAKAAPAPLTIRKGARKTAWIKALRAGREIQSACN
jgi:hypothetical protein